MNSPGYDSQDENCDTFDYDQPYEYAEQDIEFSEKNRCEDFQYVKHNVEEICGILNEHLQQMCRLIDVPETIARRLLVKYAWDVNNAKLHFLSDSLGFMIEENLLPAKNIEASISDSPAIMATLSTIQRLGSAVLPYFTPISISSDSLCPICFSEPSQPEKPIHSQHLGVTDLLKTVAISEREHPFDVKCRLYGLSCGHRFCPDCWSSYLDIQITDTTCYSNIICMSDSCNLVVPEDFLLTLLCNPKARSKYLKGLFTHMVSTHPSLRSCPGPDCSTIIRALEPVKARRINCPSCQHEFCFACGDVYHAPTTCSQMKQWWSRWESDLLTAKYIGARTKLCPVCSVCIEKDGGCNHMICSKCSYEFCWVCLAEYKNHVCGRYNPDEDALRESAERSLRRYLFYFERWACHDQSLKLEREHRTRVMKRIDAKIMDSQGTWIDWQHLITAADTLRRCRHTLKFTYPLAYYMKGADRKDLFEYHQALLEGEVEDLAWKIEHSELPDRAALQNAMHICEKHRLALLQEFLD